ncbi:MAG: TetR family transcriptional regulator [Gordonia sp. (in: high G+C Gram-positive bacteria)]
MSVIERRSALVEAAYRVIADHGVEGATTRRICAFADMPLASFHYAFESRTALLRAVMDTAVPSDINAMLETVSAEPGPGGRAGIALMEATMRTQLDAFSALLTADPGRLQATVALGIYAHNHPELRQHGKRMYENLYAVGASGLRAAAQRAGVSWAIPVGEIAPVMIGALLAITLVYLSTADDTVVRSLTEALITQTMSHVVVD